MKIAIEHTASRTSASLASRALALLLAVAGCGGHEHELGRFT